MAAPISVPAKASKSLRLSLLLGVASALYVGSHHERVKDLEGVTERQHPIEIYSNCVWFRLDLIGKLMAPSGNETSEEGLEDGPLPEKPGSASCLPFMAVVTYSPIFITFIIKY